VTVRRCVEGGFLAAIDAHEPDRWTAEAYTATLRRASSLALVHGDHAFALVSIAADEAELLRIVVAPRVRRQGLGRALLEACRACFVERSVVQAFLEVRVDNAPARALYAGAGWVGVGVRPRYYADGTDAVVMRLEPGRLTDPRGS